MGILRVLFGACLLASLALPAHAQSASIFLSFESDIPGDATAAGFEGWIELTSLGADVARAIDVGSGGGGGIGQPNFSELSLTKGADSASVLLWLEAISGSSLGLAQIVVLGADGKPLMEFQAHDAVVTSHSMGTAGGSASEHFTLAFTQISYAYFPPSGDKAVMGCWDLLAAKAC